MYDTASHVRPQDFTTISALVEETLGDELWAWLTRPVRGDLAANAERKIYALYYRIAYRWTVVPAAEPQRTLDGKIVCSCWLRERCPTPGKHPLGRHGSDVIPTLPSIRQTAVWFAGKRANIALLLGKRSGGLVCGDVDGRKGGTLEALWSLGWPAQTVIEKTGSGWHVYAHAEDLPSVSAYVEGIECKSDGLLTIVAPSVHADDKRYAWLPGHAPWEIAVQPLSDEVVAHVHSRAGASTVSSARLSAEDRAAMEGWRDVGLTREQVRAIALKRYRRAIWRVREDGKDRNPTMFWLARQLQSLGMAAADIYAWVEAFAEVVKNG